MKCLNCLTDMDKKYIKVCEGCFNEIEDSLEFVKTEIAELKDKLQLKNKLIKNLQDIVVKQEDKLHRRNMQIKSLRAETIRYRERLDTDVIDELDNA